MGVDELVGGPPAPGGGIPQVCRGRVVRAPVDATDSMVVALVNYSARFTYDVPAGQWVAQATLPAAGAECVVLRDDDHDVWVPAYTGGS